MKAKRFFALMLAVLMMATLCLPISAATMDIACCDDPWLEDPFYGDWEMTYDMDYHVWERLIYYYCTHCTGYYIEEDTYEEPHSLEPYIVDGEEDGVWCPECGTIFHAGE